MRKIFAFDFDGTVTNRDTLLEFIKYAKGGAALYATLLMYLPMLILMRLRLYSNHTVKEKAFTRLFRNMEATRFDSLCRRFAEDCRHLLRQQAVEYISGVANEHDTAVVIISASIENWVKPFFSDIPQTAAVIVAGTRPEVIDGVLTGRFLTANCYGREKVNRLLELFPDRSGYHLTAFGDSRGDRELLAFADEAHYKPFRR